MKVRVHYPLEAGQLALRADSDWQASLAPARVNRERTRFDFDLDDQAPFRYFKPVVEQGSGLRWSRGENFLAVRQEERVIDVYPHFADDASCHVCSSFLVPSSYRERGYDVRVFLPPGYEENPLQRFPVLYMQDGHNLFFSRESAFGETWHMQDTLGLLDRMNLIRQVIVVGIQPGDRMREYTQPGYEAYGRFLTEELKPLVDQRYRTLADARDTAVLGSSLGGVVSFYLGWQYPQVFGHVGAMSAPFGYQDDLFQRVGAEPKRSLRVYLDSGWPHDNYEVTRGMAAALRARGWRDADLEYIAFPEGQHSERSWAERVHLPFQFFFRGA